MVSDLFLCYNIFMKMTRALIFDSYFDDYRGVVLYVRIFEGEIAKNAEILMKIGRASCRERV